MPVAGYRLYGAQRAATYEAQRRSQPEWAREAAIIERAVQEMRVGATVLDVPVGTGRFLPLYEARGLVALGVDVSPDMLAEAGRKGTSARLLHGDLTSDHFLRTVGGCVDYAICLRLMNWLTPAEGARAIAQLLRVTRSTVWVSLWSAERAGLKAASAETHAEADVERWVTEAGWRVGTQHLIAAGSRRTSAIWEIHRADR